MYTKAALLDIHERTHRPMTKYLEFLADFSEEELRKDFKDLGTGSLLDQIDHIVGAEEYWLHVADQDGLPDFNEGEAPSLAETVKKREQVIARTLAFIEKLSEEELNTPRKVVVFGGDEVDLKPALIIMRTQTHYFSHFGKIASMCRSLGKPIPQGWDFPLRDL